MNFGKKFFPVLIIASFAVVGVFLFRPSPPQSESAVLPTPTPVIVKFGIKSADTFTYEGIDETDALSALKDRADISLDTSGMVSMINGRKADPAKKEFWAFYVNGEMASVGPADYKTKTGDTIEWKIETY